MLGLYLLLELEPTARPWTCFVEGITLLWFSWLSFSYHATESDFIGALDITMVIHLCMSCLWQLAGFSDMVGLALAWTVTAVLLVDVCVADPSTTMAVRYMMPILVLLVAAIVWLQWLAGEWVRYCVCFTLRQGRRHQWHLPLPPVDVHGHVPSLCCCALRQKDCTRRDSNPRPKTGA